MSAGALCDFEITGALLENAEARHQAIDGLMVPVLCFALQTVSSIGTICRVHQLFPAGAEKACEARARELVKGTQVKLQAPSVGIELTIHNATHVHVVIAPEAVPA